MTILYHKIWGCYIALVTGTLPETSFSDMAHTSSVLKSNAKNLTVIPLFICTLQRICKDIQSMAIFLEIPFSFPHTIPGFKLSPLPSALYQYSFSFPHLYGLVFSSLLPLFFSHSCIQNTNPSSQFLEFSYSICPTYIIRSSQICGSGRDMKLVTPTFDTEGTVKEKRGVILSYKYFLSLCTCMFIISFFPASSP